jgi:hypothetical protein
MLFAAVLLGLAAAANFGAVKASSHLRRTAQYPNVRSAIASSPTLSVVIPDVLTCPLLEAEVSKTCGKVPVYVALKQFDGNMAECETARTHIVQFAAVLQRFLGPEATCSSEVEAWQHSLPGFDNFESCRRFVSRGKFGEICGFVPAPAVPAAR